MFLKVNNSCPAKWFRYVLITNKNNKQTLQMILLFGTISLSLIFSQSVQPGHSQAIRTFDVEAKLDHSVIERGDTQTIHVSVEDKESDQPIAGAYVEALVTYPGGETVKSINSLTDENGRTSIYVPSGSGTEFGKVFVNLGVSLTGFNQAFMVIEYKIV